MIIENKWWIFMKINEFEKSKTIFWFEKHSWVERNFQTYTLTYIWFRELVSRKRKMMLWSDQNRHSDWEVHFRNV